MFDFQVDLYLSSIFKEDEFKDVYRTACKLKLQYSPDILPWSIELALNNLSNFAAKLQGLLNSGLNKGQELPLLSLLPPLDTIYLPNFRVWIPQTKTNSLIPWECVGINDEAHLCLDPRISLIRYSQTNSLPRSQNLLSDSIRILGAVSIPNGAPNVNVEIQRQAIDKAIQSGLNTRKDLVTWFRGGDLNTLRRKIIETGVSGVHIIAHGLPGRILWQDNNNNAVWVTGDQFAEYFRDLKLSFIFLSVCESSTPEPNKKTSVATELLKSGVQTCIAMQANIEEGAAAAFSEGFYSSLAKATSSSLDRLVSEGRIRVHSLGSPYPSWAVPILLVRDRAIYLTTK